MSSTTNKQIVRRLFEEAFNHDRGELVAASSAASRRPAAR